MLEEIGELLHMGVQFFIKFVFQLVIVFLVEALPSLHKMVGIPIDKEVVQVAFYQPFNRPGAREELFHCAHGLLLKHDRDHLVRLKNDMVTAVELPAMREDILFLIEPVKYFRILLAQILDSLL